MWVGVALAIALAWTVGSITFRFRLRGHYFTLATIAIAEMLRIAALHINYIGAAAGLMVPTTENSVLYFVSTEKHLYYYTILVMLGAVLVAVWALERSKTGVYWLAIREDEHAAEASGIDTGRYKLRAMMISSAFVAVGGTFYAQYVTYIDPETVLGVLPSVEMLLPAIVGGMGTLFGPLLGAIILVPLSEGTKAWFTSSRGIHMLVYGIVLMLFLRFMSQGLLGVFDRFRKPARSKLEGLLGSAAPEKRK
jgi:branched-chain amino acid transport system permease protein